MSLPRVELLILLGVFGVYVAESWLSCRRLSAFVRKSRWFYAWDSLLTVLPFLAMGSFLSESSAEWRCLVVLSAVVGGLIGTAASRELSRN